MLESGGGAYASVKIINSASVGSSQRRTALPLQAQGGLLRTN